MIIYNFRYYTEDSDREMDVWIVIQDTAHKHLTLVVTPYKVNILHKAPQEIIHMETESKSKRELIFEDSLKM